MSALINPAARLLNAAAEHIEKVGLNQDGDYYSREDQEAGKPMAECRACAVGALQIVGTGNVGGGAYWPFSAKYDARTALSELVHSEHGDYGVPHWNDHLATQEQVTDTMRRAAQKLEAGA